MDEKDIYRAAKLLMDTTGHALWMLMWVRWSANAAFYVTLTKLN